MCFPWPLLLIRVLLTTLLYCYFLYNFLVHPHVLYVVSYSSHGYCKILCIAHWNCISVSVHVVFYFEVLLAFMFIFETENRIKFSSHNTGHLDHQSASCLKNQSLAGFWMLHEKNRLKFSLQHLTSLGDRC